MTPDTPDLMALLKESLRNARSGTDTRSRQTRRQECATDGHRYRVHGKANPTKVMCSRCEVSWAIGPRTEPS